MTVRSAGRGQGELAGSAVRLFLETLVSPKRTKTTTSEEETFSFLQRDAEVTFMGGKDGFQCLRSRGRISFGRLLRKLQFLGSDFSVLSLEAQPVPFSSSLQPPGAASATLSSMGVAPVAAAFSCFVVCSGTVRLPSHSTSVSSSTVGNSKEASSSAAISFVLSLLTHSTASKEAEGSSSFRLSPLISNCVLQLPFATLPMRISSTRVLEEDGEIHPRRRHTREESPEMQQLQEKSSTTLSPPDATSHPGNKSQGKMTTTTPIASKKSQRPQLLQTSPEEALTHRGRGGGRMRRRGRGQFPPSSPHEVKGGGRGDFAAPAEVKGGGRGDFAARGHFAAPAEVKGGGRGDFAAPAEGIHLTNSFRRGNISYSSNRGGGGGRGRLGQPKVKRWLKREVAVQPAVATS